LIKKNSKNATLLARLGEVNAPRRSAKERRTLIGRRNEIRSQESKIRDGYAAALVQMRRFAEAGAHFSAGNRDGAKRIYGAREPRADAFRVEEVCRGLARIRMACGQPPRNCGHVLFHRSGALIISASTVQALDAYEKFLSRADPTGNKLDIEKINSAPSAIARSDQTGTGVNVKSLTKD